MKIIFSKKALKEYNNYQTKRPKLGDRADALIRSILSDGIGAGLGKPEKLKYRPNEWSRRLNQHNRLTYRVEGDTLHILSLEGHYK
jgi:toxin YoeB